MAGAGHGQRQNREGGEASRVAFLDGRWRALRPQILLDFKTAIAMLQGMMAYTPGPILQHPV